MEQISLEAQGEMAEKRWESFQRMIELQIERTSAEEEYALEIAGVVRRPAIPYRTTSVNEIDWLRDPEVAFTLMVYVPAGVPFELGGGLLLPPPQEQMNISNTTGIIRIRLKVKPLPSLLVGRMIPTRTTAQSHGDGVRKGWSVAAVDAVVVTLTAKFEAVAALTVTVAGTEQFA